MLRRYLDIDVFTDQPYRGNPLAVVVDGDGLTTEEMQRFAHWTNLSETVFLLPPTDPAADYRVRIFDPMNEMTFAGHPTLGSCHAWLATGGTPRHADRVVQECGVGLVTVARDSESGRLAFAAPPLRRSGPLEPEERADALATLGLSEADVVDSAWIDNGPGWMGFLLPSAEAVLAIRPGATTRNIGVVGPHSAGSECAVEVRAFFPLNGLTAEDPVTGSLNASIAQWLIGKGTLPAAYTAAQGTVLGRAGRVHVRRDPGDGGDTWVGGSVITCVEGSVRL